MLIDMGNTALIAENNTDILDHSIPIVSLYCPAKHYRRAVQSSKVTAYYTAAYSFVEQRASLHFKIKGPPTMLQAYHM